MFPCAQIAGAVAVVHSTYCLHTIVHPFTQLSVHRLKSASLGVLFVTYSASLLQLPRAGVPYRDTVVLSLVAGSNILYILYAALALHEAHQHDTAAAQKATAQMRGKVCAHHGTCFHASQVDGCSVLRPCRVDLWDLLAPFVCFVVMFCSIEPCVWAPQAIPRETHVHGRVECRHTAYPSASRGV